jgi:hypothetical protein
MLFVCFACLGVLCTTLASLLYVSDSEVFQRGYRELADFAIIAAMAPITWDFSSSVISTRFSHPYEFLRFHVFACFECCNGLTS